MPGLKDWLRKASADLKLAKKAIGDDETLDPAVYLTHQCAEKSLKAYLIFIRKPISKTHSLGILLDICTSFDVEFMLLKNGCKLLDPYGTNSRYPHDFFSVNQADLIKALNIASKIFDFIEDKVLQKG